MDEDQYDEFGNLIENGSTSESSSEEEEEEASSPEEMQQQDSDDEDENEEDRMDIDKIPNDQAQQQVVLHEDKQYYPSMQQTFGADVETIVATTDDQDINVPIVQPDIDRTFKIEEKDLPETTYSKEYMWQSLSIPSKVRNIALVGSLHSGKTSFLDLLINETHMLQISANMKSYKPLRYADNHKIEIKRGLSIKSTTMSLLLPNLKGNSYVVNILDTPGHVNFIDELAVSTRLADTLVLIVDVCEGLTKGLELAIQHALQTNSPMCLVLTKLDRLITELRLPPLDSYFKMRNVIHDINSFISDSVFVQNATYTRNTRLSPELGNVCFASSSLNFCFSLRSFSEMYIKTNNLKISSIDAFARKLWGDIYFINNKFTTKPEDATSSAFSRTFVKFILDPIYKVVTHTLTKSPRDLQTFLSQKLNITSIKPNKFKLDVQLLLKEIFVAFLGRASSPFMDMLESQAPSPIDLAATKFAPLISGKASPEIMEHISKCDPEGPLIAYVTKLVDTKDATRFYSQVRVLSGTLMPSTSVKLLGESFTVEYEEDIKIQPVKKTFLSCARYRIEVNGLPAGSIGLISGHEIDTFITKTATIFDPKFNTSDLFIIRPLDRLSKPVFKVAVQPFKPSELAKFGEGLKKLQRSYIGCEIKVEEGGEHVIIGYGELYMDCLLHDLRHLYTDIEIKVSDPMTRFAETCLDMSLIKLPIESNNKKNNLTIIAEPLEPEIGTDIELGIISINEPARKLAKAFRTRYNWDALAARSIWSFGPDDFGTSVLLDDTFEDEVDKVRLKSVKESIKHGFRLATREGPLCDEPIRNVKFRIIDASISKHLLEATSGHIIQMVRKACHAAVMTSTPRLLEPIYEVEVICTTSIVKELSNMLEKRRGGIFNERPIEGTQLFKVIGFIPVIESIGLETDIRLSTQGQAMPQFVFSKWQVVPGDPLDSDAYIPVLKRAPINSLARDFTIKTRKRKGLTNEPTLQKFVDEETWSKLKSTGMFN